MLHFRAGLMYTSTLSFQIQYQNRANLDKNIQQSKTIMSFKHSLLQIGQPNPKHVYDIQNFTGLKLLTMLRLEVSHLNEHNFNHNL